jgi:hypothetical protein
MTQIGSFIVFLFQPFIGFFFSLKNFSSIFGKLIFIVFATLWGYCQSFSYPPSDVYRLGASFCQHGIYDFQTIIEMFDEGKAIDGYLLSINFLAHQFSNNAKVYFAMIGFVYGVLCCAVLSSLIKESGKKCEKHLAHILFLLFATSSFANIAMPRYWTAAWVATFLFLRITHRNILSDLYSIILLPLLPLIHFSYVPIAAALLVVAIVKNVASYFPNFLFVSVCVIFVLSFILPETLIGNLIPQEMLEESSKLSSKYTYVSGGADQEERVVLVNEISAYREANSFVTKLFQRLMKLGSFLLLLYFQLRKNILKKDSKVWKSYISVLIMALAAYFMSIIPSTGWRYVNVLLMMLYVLLYRYYNVFRPVQFGRVIFIMYIMNIYTISFMIYVAYVTVDLILFYAPFPFVIIHGIDFPPVNFV